MTGAVGVCTKTHAPSAFTIGDVIFAVERIDGMVVHGRLMVTSGRWEHVVGIVAPDGIRFSGGGWDWTMSRIS
jgi:hypothetical protein